MIALHSAAKFSLDVAEGLDGPSVGLHWQRSLAVDYLNREVLLALEGNENAVQI